MMGEIFNIQKFCVNDGPGIRTNVFLKGCPLRCIWCHNPEGQRLGKEILFYPDKCTGCRKCKDLTVEDTDFFCVNNAKEICGKTVTTEEVLEEVLRDKVFYESSGGGVTLSGGDPLYQHEFALDILKKSKAAGLHTAVETCGFAAKGVLARIAEFTDLFLYDFKESDPEKHKAYTGVDLAPILENLAMLNEMGKAVILRCPIIPGYNDRTEHFDAISKLANSLPVVQEVNIEPYHSFGENKYTALGLQTAKIPMMEEAQVQQIIAYIGEKSRVPVKKA